MELIYVIYLHIFIVCFHILSFVFAMWRQRIYICIYIFQVAIVLKTGVYIIYDIDWMKKLSPTKNAACEWDPNGYTMPWLQELDTLNEKGSQLQTAHRSMFNTNVLPFGLLQCMVDIGQYLAKLGRLQDHIYMYKGW